MSSKNETPNGPIVRHRLLVRNDHGDRLLAATMDAVRLPAFTSQDRHTAEVDYVVAAMADRFGVATTFLRSLSHSPPVGGIVERVHELELNGRAPNALNWLSPNAFEDAADRAAIARWRTASLQRDTAEGREWTRPGWLAEVRSWIDAALRDAGNEAPRTIRQLRSWPSSCVLHVETRSAQYFFKALPHAGRVEVALSNYLARHFPDVVPPVIAWQPARRWLLLGACRGRNLETVRDIAAWEHAVARYGRLQVDCIARVDELSALGVARRPLESLAGRIDSLADDIETSEADGADSLSVEEQRRFRAAAARLRRNCEELDACDIPATLEHGDFWPGNIFVEDASAAVIDWEDAAIAHPFFSLAPLSVGLMNAGLGEEGALSRIEAAYAAPFQPLVSTERLVRALRLAAPLCFVEMAARYRNQPASITALHPWMRDLVAHSVRLALLRLESPVQ